MVTVTVNLSGTLLDSSGVGIVGQSITITRTPSGGSPVTLPAVTTGTGGAYTATDSVVAPGTYIYVGTFAAAAGYLAATSTSESVSPTVQPVLTLTVTVS
jgi:hypothetical protein